MNVEDIIRILEQWGQTGEFRNISQDEFLTTMLAAQKDRSTVHNALYLCWRRYDKNRPPPADLIKVLLETPIDSLNHPLYWEEIVLLYLGKYKVQAKYGSIILLKAAYAHCLQNVLSKMLETNPAVEVCKAMVLAVTNAKETDLLIMRYGLRECKDCFNEEVVKLIHKHVKTRAPKVLAPRVAAVLPNDLSVVTQWMSLCEAQKTDVSARLLYNMMDITGSQSFDIEYYQSRLDDACKANQNATDLVKTWLALYQASLHYKIGEILWQRGNETFKIGFVETAADKEYIDSLETWLEDPGNKIVGKDKLLNNIRTDRELWGRRKDGHVWHIKLVKILYESYMFKSVEVECKVGSKLVDILLEDECGKDIHIEAWDGMTEMAHSMIRMLQTGERFNINMLGQRGDEDAIFEWNHANKWLNRKVKQLPQTGRNFVVAQHPPNELIWQSMDGVDLKGNTCAIQIVWPNAHVWCKDCKHMGTTSQLISKALSCEYCSMT